MICSSQTLSFTWYKWLTLTNSFQYFSALNSAKASTNIKRMSLFHSFKSKLRKRYKVAFFSLPLYLFNLKMKLKLTAFYSPAYNCMAIKGSAQSFFLFPPPPSPLISNQVTLCASCERFTFISFLLTGEVLLCVYVFICVYICVLFSCDQCILCCILCYFNCGFGKGWHKQIYFRRASWKKWCVNKLLWTICVNVQHMSMCACVCVYVYILKGLHKASDLWMFDLV